MCDALILEPNKRGYDYECTYKPVATATSSRMKDVRGNWIKMRLCSKHAGIYESKYVGSWKIERDLKP